jgi:hypothetical protein
MQRGCECNAGQSHSVDDVSGEMSQRCADCWHTRMKSCARFQIKWIIPIIQTPDPAIQAVEIPVIYASTNWSNLSRLIKQSKTSFRDVNSRRLLTMQSWSWFESINSWWGLDAIVSNNWEQLKLMNPNLPNLTTIHDNTINYFEEKIHNKAFR